MIDWRDAEKLLQCYEGWSFEGRLRFEDEVNEALVKSPFLPEFKDAIQERGIIFRRALVDARKVRGISRKTMIPEGNLTKLKMAVYVRLAWAMNEVDRFTG